jgi:hypothetical protein
VTKLEDEEVRDPALGDEVHGELPIAMGQLVDLVTPGEGREG